MLFSIEQSILVEETLANLCGWLPNPPMFPPSKASLYMVCIHTVELVVSVTHSSYIAIAQLKLTLRNSLSCRIINCHIAKCKMVVLLFSVVLLQIWITAGSGK